MAITTVDVVRNVIASKETISNGSCVVYCPNTGAYQAIAATFQGSFTYNQLETKYTNKFDNINYYNGVNGGTP
jgi:Pyruvate/2-oxoacid:ferredoxin oxidoreductase delta subunit